MHFFWSVIVLDFDKIFVLGAGAIGSVFGALLARHYDVVLVGNSSHVQAIKSKGLMLCGDINETFHVKADTEINTIPHRALILLTTKAYDSARSVEKIKHLLMEDTVILVLQNGIGNEEVVKKIVGYKVKVLRGVTAMAAEFFEAGKVKFWHGRTMIEQNEIGLKICEAFNSCGLDACVSNMKVEVWNKAVVNCVVNPLTALLRVRNCDVCVDTLKAVRHGVIKECIRVGMAEGVKLPEQLEEKVDMEIAKFTNFSSMYQDIVKGKRTEIDFLNGKIVELGKKHGVPTPINETLTACIKFLEGKNAVSRSY